LVSKAEMVSAASVHDMDARPPRDTGSLPGDLLAFLHLIRETVGRPAARQANAALVVAFHWPVTDQRLRDTATVVAAGLVALANRAPGGRSPARRRR
jgi:hypothetical protein